MPDEDVRELMMVNSLEATLDEPGECEKCDLIRRMIREYREVLEDSRVHYVA